MDVMTLNTKINNFLSKFVNNKSLYIIIIIGVAFMLLPAKSSRKDNTIANEYEAYSDEERLSSILSRVSGAGKVSVMITYYGTKELALAYEEKEQSDSKESAAVLSSGSPFVKGMLFPNVKGAVIVATGAGSPAVKKELIEAAEAALNIGAHRICVLEGKERD